MAAFEDNSTDICGYPETFSTRRAIQIVGSSCIALVGILMNGILVKIFLWPRVLTSSTMYMTAIGLLDLLLCAIYVLLFGIQVFVGISRIAWLFVVHVHYSVTVFYLSHVVQLALPYMMICTAMEQWICQTQARAQMFSLLVERRMRRILAASVFLISILMRLPVPFSMSVEHYPLCDDPLKTYDIRTQGLAEKESFTIYELHIINVIRVFIPFVVLVILNTLIMQTLWQTRNLHRRSIISMDLCEELQKLTAVVVVGSRRDQQIEDARVQLRETRVQLRNVIFTTVAVASSYLFCNAFSVFLAVFEKMDHPWLFEEDDKQLHSQFYINMSDFVSFLFMIVSAGRPLIYYKCNRQIRAEFKSLLYQNPRNETSLSEQICNNGNIYCGHSSV